MGSRDGREDVSVDEGEELGNGMAARALRDSPEMVTGNAKRELSEAKEANAWCRSADAVSNQGGQNGRGGGGDLGC